MSDKIPLREGKFYPVLKAVELKNGERLFLEIKGQPVVVFNIAGNFYAIGDACTHDNDPLGDGDLDGFEIICPRHGARFDVRDGRATHMPAVANTPCYPTRVVEGMLEIRL
jgi:3-phenylpropionate/trans-cinnamate dioxygenase ferredoxin subunit